MMMNMFVKLLLKLCVPGLELFHFLVVLLQLRPELVDFGIQKFTLL